MLEKPPDCNWFDIWCQDMVVMVHPKTAVDDRYAPKDKQQLS